MVSKFIRRSGISVCLIADLLQWVPDTVVQVGVGCNPEETAVFLDAWPDVSIIGFEANPQCFNAAVRRYPGRLVQLAVSNEPKQDVKLFVPPRHKDGSSLYAFDALDNPHTEITNATSLDVWFADKPRISRKTLLWLDCEGSELDVLRGASQFVDSVECINVEMTAKPVGSNWCDSNQVHDHLLGLGFKRQWVHTQRTSAGQCDAIYVRPELFKAEFCCCPCQITKE